MDKIMQSAYFVCVFLMSSVNAMCYFSCEAQKITISRGVNLISNSWQNPRWRPRWRPLLVTS